MMASMIDPSTLEDHPRRRRVWLDRAIMLVQTPLLGTALAFDAGLGLGVVLAIAWLRSPAPGKWVYDFQTLLAGILAVLAAAFTIFSTARIEAVKRERDLSSARSVLPLALTEICEYCERCARQLDDLRRTAVGGRIRLPGSFAAPVLANSAVPVLRDCIRSADRPHSERLIDLARNMQVQGARHRGLAGINDRTISPIEIAQAVYDAAQLYAQASSLFDFARGEEGEYHPPDESSVHSALNILGFSTWDFEELDEMLERRQRARAALA
jgi:hypothetical protein